MLRFASVTSLCILLMLSAGANANCECTWRGPFLLAHKDVPDTFLAEVINVNGNAFDVKIKQVYRGEEWRETVRVWAKTKDLCRPSVELFSPGSQWVLALHKIEEPPKDGFDPFTPSQSYGRKNDYFISSCGAFWLSVEGSKASGNLSSMTPWEWQPLMTPVALTDLEAYFAGEKSETELMLSSDEASGPEALKELTRKHLNTSDQ